MTDDNPSWGVFSVAGTDRKSLNSIRVKVKNSDIHHVGLVKSKENDKFIRGYKIPPHEEEELCTIVTINKDAIVSIESPFITPTDDGVIHHVGIYKNDPKIKHAEGSITVAFDGAQPLFLELRHGNPHDDGIEDPSGGNDSTNEDTIGPEMDGMGYVTDSDSEDEVDPDEVDLDPYVTDSDSEDEVDPDPTEVDQGSEILDSTDDTELPYEDELHSVDDVSKKSDYPLFEEDKEEDEKDDEDDDEYYGFVE